VGIVIALPKPQAPHLNNSEQPAQQIAVKQPVAGESEAQVKKAIKKVKPKQKQKPKPKKVAERPPTPNATVEPSGTKTDWMRSAGIPEKDWQYVDYIVSKESSWNPHAVNASSGACSLVQALPCSKIPGNWRDPVTALKWQFAYVVSRYGDYEQAHRFWESNRWY